MHTTYAAVLAHWKFCWDRMRDTMRPYRARASEQMRMRIMPT